MLRDAIGTLRGCTAWSNLDSLPINILHSSLLIVWRFSHIRDNGKLLMPIQAKPCQLIKSFLLILGGLKLRWLDYAAEAEQSLMH